MATDPYPEEESPYGADDRGEELEPFRPLRGVATLTCVLIAGDVLLGLVQTYMDFWLIGIAQATLAGRPVPLSEGELFDTLSVALTVVHLTVRLATAVAFITWLYRAYKNVPTLGAGDTKYTAGWAVGAWFVPILNLFRPYQIVREAWDAGESYVAGEDADRIVRPAGHALLGWWWGTWILSGIVGQVAVRMSLSARGPQEILAATHLGLANEIIALPCAFLAIAVVLRLTARQEAREEALASAEERWEAERAARRALPPVEPGSEHIRARRGPRDLDAHFREYDDRDR